MSQPDPIGNEVRRVRRERRLGPNAVCVLCGFADPRALVRLQRSFVELHHPLAVAHGPGATVPLCRNCHAIETERMRDAAIPLNGDELSTPEVLSAVLRADAVFLRAQADAFEGFAERAQRLTTQLDDQFPGWRELESGHGPE